MAAEPLSDGTAGTIDLGDLTVRRLGFGAMRITGEGIWGPPADRGEAIRVLRRAVELGINLIDTADSYGPDISEELIAEALRPYPEDLVIATKGGLTRTGPNVWPRNGRPEHLRAACEGSLRRLGLERIDLYQLHSPDAEVPYEESVGAIKELQDEGKIRQVGVSNVNLEQLATAREIVEVVSVQNRYNLADRHSADVLAACQRDGLAFIPWFPLDAGKIAEPAVALAWLLAQDRVLPIPGTSQVAHLEANVEAARLELGGEELAALDAAA
ncbi:MAG: aldo/keto reductase [Actinobacteria bacterium]|nr:aldo/keto reductase [Actinomycetota bacterium]